MKVYSLSGPSGTGKSTSALAFAHQLGVEAIIDDGLLIVNGVRVAGVSAKFEKNTITAVRRAIFTDEVHREAVQKALANYQVQSILLIGTSNKMTNSIAKRLALSRCTLLLCGGYSFLEGDSKGTLYSSNTRKARDADSLSPSGAKLF